MEIYTRRLFVRMSESGLAKAKALSESLGISLSDLVRILLHCARPGAFDEPNSIVVVDLVTTAKLLREMRRWGNHYNQAVHALNSIAYYLRLNEVDSDDVLEELEKVNHNLEILSSEVKTLCAEVSKVTARPIAHI